MKILIQLLSILALHFATLAQNTKPVKVNIQDLKSINTHAAYCARESVRLIRERAALDSLQTKRSEDFLFSLIQRYYVHLKTKNYTLKPILYKERIQLKTERDRYLKALLTDYQYGRYREFATAVEKKELEKSKKDPKNLSEEDKIYLETLGWDLLLIPVEIVEK
ncbi:MAG: hypothetical protein JNM44_02020 [Chitinophagaceae bacterium]|nr:hypothetical protein [Chitinophagaceae bacterium]